MLLSLVNTPVSFQAFSSVKEAYKPNPQGSDVLSRSALTLVCQAHTPHQHQHAYAVCDSAWKLGEGAKLSSPISPSQPVLIVHRTERQFKVIV